ncbi:MAG: hypothetical protein LBC49_05575 [Bacteroidales bacterium]|jgi:predicted nucleic acid-binding protein|nr:hypothetical protein [Bacteroidales bacterium]
MKIIVDANIIFSGILNSNGKIGDLLINSSPKISFIAPEFLRTEIFKHYDKLTKISGLSIDRVWEAEYQLFKSITFISEEQIKKQYWEVAYSLVSDIDIKDTPYIAFTKQFKCKLWTGDKKLQKGLLKKGFTNIITTNELFDMRNTL